MKALDLIIIMSIIISFSVSIFASYIITNNKNLQTDTICDINCNIINNHDGDGNSDSDSSISGGDPTIPVLSDPRQFIKGIVGNTSDSIYDTQLITLDKTAQIPVIHGFYDIVSTQITKMYSDDLIFTINLKDDPNKNSKYETTYLWVLSHFDPSNDKNQIYTIIIPNFGNHSNFKNKGWYLAIYDNINNIYSVPLSRINNMADNNVEITIDPEFIGNIKNFNYTTAVMIRVNDTFLDKPPDYLVDSSPDNDAFWSGWFI
jgi:hypothetical protein